MKGMNLMRPQNDIDFYDMFDLSDNENCAISGVSVMTVNEISGKISYNDVDEIKLKDSFVETLILSVSISRQCPKRRL